MKQIMIFLAISTFILLINSSIQAQIIDVNKQVKKKSEQRVNKNINKGIDKGLDEAEKGLKNNHKKNNQNKNQNKNSTNTNNQTTEENNSNTQTESINANSKFDFIAGEKIIFYEDFMQDAVGDFPALWNTNGSGEIVTIDNYPGHWLMMREKSSYCYMFSEEMPENYTIEFDYIRESCESNSNFTHFYLSSVPKEKSPFVSNVFPGFKMELCHEQSVDIENFGVEPVEKVHNRVASSLLKKQCGKKVRFSIWIQKQRVRIYIDNEKVIDIPKLLPKDKKINNFKIYKRTPDKKDYLTNIRLAVGAPDLRNKLLTEGKIVTYGILFDSGSDKIKAESNGVLKELSTILKDNPTIKIKIVGHTDADGDDKTNKELSLKRAISVKNELSNTFGIEQNRIETDGKGENEPVAPNDSALNKAKNRRVEIIKL